MNFFIKKPSILILPLLLCMWGSLTHCTTTDRSKSDPAQSTAPNTGMNEYRSLQPGERLSDWIGEKISFEGTIADFPLEHMMRPSLTMPGTSPDTHQYIDPLKKFGFGQLLVYFSEEKVQWPEAGPEQIFRLYGVVGSISGPGKGGGEHTEYYLELERVELVR